MEIVPDEIYVQVDLTEYKKRGDKVEIDKIKEDFLAICKAVGIPDSSISLASFDGYNLASIWRRRRRDPDLMASVSYQIKFKTTKPIDDLVDRLDDQATKDFRISRVSHSKIAEFRRQLKVLAVKASKEKATYLTEAVNEQLGQAITIKEPDESTSSDVLAGNLKYRTSSNEVGNYMMKKEGYGLVDSGVDFRKIKLRYEVNVLYALK